MYVYIYIYIYIYIKKKDCYDFILVCLFCCSLPSYENRLYYQSDSKIWLNIETRCYCLEITNKFDTISVFSVFSVE